MQKLYFLFILMSLFVMSCNNTGTTTDKNGEQKDTTNQQANNQHEHPDQKQDATGFDVFWDKFKKAVASGDKSAVQRLTHFGALTQADFDSSFEIFFQEKDAKSMIGKSSASEATPSESTFEGITVEEVRQFSITFGNPEGESSLMYFFGKVDGKYGLVYLAAAG